MNRTSCLAWGLGAVLFAATVQAADGWTQLRTGMSRAETSGVLGAPLLKNTGHGFELWLYEGGAEVVCYRGVVVAWTAPQRIGPEIAKVTPPPKPQTVAPAKAHSVSRQTIERVYDRFPAFRTEIRM